MDVARLTDAEVSRSFPGRNFRCGRNKSCRSGINPHERTGPTQGRGHRGDVAVYRDTDRVFWRCAYAALVAEIVAVPTRAPVSRAVARRADWSRRHSPPLSDSAKAADYASLIRPTGLTLSRSAISNSRFSLVMSVGTGTIPSRLVIAGNTARSPLSL